MTQTYDAMVSFSVLIYVFLCLGVSKVMILFMKMLQEASCDF